MLKHWTMSAAREPSAIGSLPTVCLLATSTLSSCKVRLRDPTPGSCSWTLQAGTEYLSWFLLFCCEWVVLGMFLRARRPSQSLSHCGRLHRGIGLDSLRPCGLNKVLWKSSVTFHFYRKGHLTVSLAVIILIVDKCRQLHCLFYIQSPVIWTDIQFLPWKKKSASF